MRSTNLNSVKEGSNIQKTKTLRRLLKLTVPYYRKIILAFVCVILVIGAQLIKPYILKLVIDDFLTSKVVQSGFYSITNMGLLYFVVVTLGGLLSIAQVILINKVGQDIMRTLRSKVFRTVQLLPLWYLDRTSSGRLITRATNDVAALSEMYTDVLIKLFKDVFMIIGIIYIMIIINLELALISFCVVPFVFGLVFILKKKIKRNFTKMKSLIGRINGFMAENISGMKIVQIFHGEKEKKKNFQL